MVRFERSRGPVCTEKWSGLTDKWSGLKLNEVRFERTPLTLTFKGVYLSNGDDTTWKLDVLPVNKDVNITKVLTTLERYVIIHNAPILVKKTKSKLWAVPGSFDQNGGVMTWGRFDCKSC